jgi:hypothetical protein
MSGCAAATVVAGSHYRRGAVVTISATVIVGSSDARGRSVPTSGSWRHCRRLTGGPYRRRWHRSRGDYLDVALLAGSSRYGLDGNVAGEVTEAEVAALRAARVRAAERKAAVDA